MSSSVDDAADTAAEPTVDAVVAAAEPTVDAVVAAADPTVEAAVPTTFTVPIKIVGKLNIPKITNVVIVVNTISALPPPW